MALGGSGRLGPCPCSSRSSWLVSSLPRSLRRFTLLSPLLPRRSYHVAVRQDYAHSSRRASQSYLEHTNFAQKKSKGVEAWADERSMIQLRKAKYDVQNGLTDGRIPLPSSHFMADGSLDHESSFEYLGCRNSLVSCSMENKPSSLDLDLEQNQELGMHMHMVLPYGANKTFLSETDVRKNVSEKLMPMESDGSDGFHNVRRGVSTAAQLQLSSTEVGEDLSHKLDIKHNGSSMTVYRNSRSSSSVRPNGSGNRIDMIKQFDCAETKLHERNQTSCHGSAKESAKDIRKELALVYEEVLEINNIALARDVVRMLTTKYRDHIHACDTEVANIDVKQETPVGHGEIICFSIYSGKDGQRADFGNGKSCIWVDVLDGGREVLLEFAPFFEDPCIKKVWHNYSFDSHIIENYGIKLSGFYADTMHLARLWNSSRRADGGYSLEALSGDPNVMPSKFVHRTGTLNIGKLSMKTIFGKKKVKKDGSEGKITIIEPVEKLQKTERKLWICYSSLDSICTLGLFESLKKKLIAMKWNFDGRYKGTMYQFYEEYWRPFGALLTKMETEGMLVDRGHLLAIEKIAIAEQQLAAEKFRRWASKYCLDAKYMNVGSDAQIRQLFFGGVLNRKNHNEELPAKRTFKVPNTEYVLTDGKKNSKNRTIELWKICENNIETEMYTASGWPSVCGDALRSLAGKISADLTYVNDDESIEDNDNDAEVQSLVDLNCHDSSKYEDISVYGYAYQAFSGGKEGKEACHAIAALCEVNSIDKLISGFIRPLQGNHISCDKGRIHCSLNINTETGRLSARTPNLQNQPALEKDRYKIRQAFVAAPGNSLIVADYGQLELRILAHLANCKSMLDAFKAGGDFHSRTAMNMYEHIRKAVEDKSVLLEWHPRNSEDSPPVPLLKDAFAAERRKAKMLNFSIAYGKTPHGLAKDWKVSLKEAKETVDLWYKDRKEVSLWQRDRKKQAEKEHCVYTLLGRSRVFPNFSNISMAQRAHIERAAINTPVQGSAADVAMCAMLEIDRNDLLRKLGWRLLLQVHDEVILEGPTESAETAKSIVVECMSKPFYGKNILKVDLAVDAKCAQNWYAGK